MQIKTEGLAVDLKTILASFLFGKKFKNFSHQVDAKMETFGLTKYSSQHKSLSKQSQLNSSATTNKDLKYRLTASSNAIITFRTPENQEIPLKDSSNEVELVCREAISNECNIKESFQLRPFDFLRILDLIIASKHAKNRKSATSDFSEEPLDFNCFKEFLNSFSSLGYSFSEAQIHMLFRRLDKNHDRLVCFDDFSKEF